MTRFLRRQMIWAIAIGIVVVALTLFGVSSKDILGLVVLMWLGVVIVFGRPGKRFIREIKEMWETKRIV